MKEVDKLLVVVSNPRSSLDKSRQASQIKNKNRSVTTLSMNKVYIKEVSFHKSLH